MDENNKIWRMAQAKLAAQAAALNPDMSDAATPPTRRKPGPQTGHTVDIIKQAIVVGRNKTPVPMDEVEHLASLGCNDNEIAQYFGITSDSLRRHFEEYLIKGRHQLRVSLRQAQIRVALEGQPTMLVWLGKNLLSQNEMGQANDDNRPLPWTDSMDDDVVEEDAEEDAEDILDTEKRI